MKKDIQDFTRDEWDMLEETGMLWKLYPDAPSTWYIMKNKSKCKAEDCDRVVDNPYIYCSYECGAYDGMWSVKEGWKTK